MNKFQNPRLQSILFVGGCILITLALLLRSLWMPHLIVHLLYLVGSGSYTLSWLFIDPRSCSIKTRRLQSLAFFAGVLFICSGVAALLEQQWWSILMIVATLLFIFSNLQLTNKNK